MEGGGIMLTIETCYVLHPICSAYHEICQGETPWVALGNFMNDFFGYASEQRQALLQEPCILPPEPSHEQIQWAVFCVASVDYLCHHYDLQVPSWVHETQYTTLPDPWYHGLGAKKPHIQERLRNETPQEFASRNIYCGSADRVFPDKYRAVSHQWQEQRQSA
jgi:hypothetical protein